MRRNTAAVVGTLTGTALLFGVRLSVGPIGGFALGSQATVLTPEGGTAADAQEVAPEASATAGGDGAGGNNGAAGNDTADDGGGADAGAAGTGTGDTLRDGTYRGAVSSYEYGAIQVTITVSGGQMTDLNATYPNAGRSGAINGRAIPVLRQQALAAQSADVDTVSGATLTSPAFKASLDSALNVARR